MQNAISGFGNCRPCCHTGKHFISHARLHKMAGGGGNKSQKTFRKNTRTPRARAKPAPDAPATRHRRVSGRRFLCHRTPASARAHRRAGSTNQRPMLLPPAPKRTGHRFLCHWAPASARCPGPNTNGPRACTCALGCAWVGCVMPRRAFRASTAHRQPKTRCHRRAGELGPWRLRVGATPPAQPPALREAVALATLPACTGHPKARVP